MDKIFPNLIYKFKIPNYKELNKNLISEIYDLKNKEPDGINRSNIGGWHSDLRTTKFIDLQKIICNHYTKTILKTNKDIKPSTIWANVNNKNDSNKIHNHRGSNYSGVYYVKVPKDSGDLYFVNHVTSLTYPFNFYEQMFDEIKYEPKEGELYFYSGNLSHRVGKNLTNEDRISISFNFNYIDLKKHFKKEQE